jgi:predicted transcriptional regulator
MCEADTDTNPVPLAESHDNLSNVFQNPTTTQETILSVFDIGEAELRAYIALVEHPDSKVDHIADELNRHRRFVANSLRELHKTGLVEREKKVFESGGVGHVYSPLPVEEAESYFREHIQSWLADAHNEVKKFDRRIDPEISSFGCSDEAED